jgi:hypothetical protein
MGRQTTGSEYTRTMDKVTDYKWCEDCGEAIMPTEPILRISEPQKPAEYVHTNCRYPESE